MLTLGDMTVTALTDLARFDLPLTVAFPEADLCALPPWLGSQDVSGGMLHLAIRSWLIRLGGRTVLVDSCVGAAKSRPRWAAWDRREGAEFRAALAAENLTPADIDVVLCTHLHVDHVGWNTVLKDGRWVPTFPNARYIAGRREFAFWQAEVQKDPNVAHGAIADSVLPVVAAGQMDLVDDGWELGCGLTVTEAPGHTPGHVVLRADHGPGAIFCGDVIHTPLQLAQPQLSSAFCTDPGLARRSRLALLEELAETETHLVPAHFRDPGHCRVVREGAGFRPVWPG